MVKTFSCYSFCLNFLDFTLEELSGKTSNITIKNVFKYIKTLQPITLIIQCVYKKLETRICNIKRPWNLKQ